MPVVSKRQSGFSIESLVSKDCPVSGSSSPSISSHCCPSNQTPTAAAAMLQGLRPVHGHPMMSQLQQPNGMPHPAFLAGAGGSPYPEGLPPGFEMPNAAAAFAGSAAAAAAAAASGMGLGSGLPGMPGSPGSLPPHLLGAPGLHHKESFPFYTWLLARHGSYLSHRLTGEKIDISYISPLTAGAAYIRVFHFY